MTGLWRFISVIAMAPCLVFGAAAGPAEDIWAPDHRNGLVMRVEAAIATAQAEYGVVSEEAAREISERANTDYAPVDEIAAEYDVVRHRMVALLNVWRRSLSEEASDALHKGVTTVDVYDTVLALQLIETLDIALEDLLRLEHEALCLAEAYRTTPMMGRTLGQHALPITFGKKAATWAGVTRRNIDRLLEVRDRLGRIDVLKGAVGTHLGLGPYGYGIERRTAELLGLLPPDPADARSFRDVFAEFATTMALVSRTYAGIGNEVFHLQMTDIAEVYEERISTAVGSSTMPHKRNPSLSESLVHDSRVVSALSSVLLEDVVNHFERDNTSRPNRTLEELAITSTDMISDAHTLITRLRVDPERMRQNIDQTDGMAMSQRIVLYLGERMNREEAEQRVRDAAAESLESGIAFRDALLADAQLSRHLSDDIDHLLDPDGYLGLSAQQVDATAEFIRQERLRRGQSARPICSTG